MLGRRALLAASRSDSKSHPSERGVMHPLPTHCAPSYGISSQLERALDIFRVDDTSLNDVRAADKLVSTGVQASTFPVDAERLWVNEES